MIGRRAVFLALVVGGRRDVRGAARRRRRQEPGGPRGPGLERPASRAGGRRRVHEELDRPDRALRGPDARSATASPTPICAATSSGRRSGSRRARRAVERRAAAKGVTITRDRWGVPHVKGKTAEDVAFGAGWATAADRQLIMELLRGPGPHRRARRARRERVRRSPSRAASSGRARQTEARLARAVRAPPCTGSEGHAGDPDHRRLRRRASTRSTGRRVCRSRRGRGTTSSRSAG